MSRSSLWRTWRLGTSWEPGWTAEQESKPTVSNNDRQFTENKINAPIRQAWNINTAAILGHLANYEAHHAIHFNIKSYYWLQHRPKCSYVKSYVTFIPIIRVKLHQCIRYVSLLRGEHAQSIYEHVMLHALVRGETFSGVASPGWGRGGKIAELHCIALHCIALHCIALHCIALHCIALHCIALHCIALHCIALHCIALHCVALRCVALRCVALRCVALRCVALHCILHYITLHYITLHYITLHYITLHYMTSHHITSHHITSHHITSHHITSHHITLHYITLHYIILYYITLHYITLHYITLRHFIRQSLLQWPMVHQQSHSSSPNASLKRWVFKSFSKVSVFVSSWRLNGR